MLRRLWILSLATALTGSVCAQRQFTNRHLDRESGLTSDRFNSFFGHDSHGFHWIGSPHGAFRYDGHILRQYSMPGVDADQFILSNFFEDKRGNVWTSTADALARYSYGIDGFEQVVRDQDPVNAFGVQIASYNPSLDILWTVVGDSVYRVDPLAPALDDGVALVKGVRWLKVPTSDTFSTRLLGFPWLRAAGIEIVDLSQSNDGLTRESQDVTVSSAVVSGGVVDHLGCIWLASDIGLIAYDIAADESNGVFVSPEGVEAKVYDAAVMDTLLIVSPMGREPWLFDPVRRKWLGVIEVPNGSGPSPCDEPGTLYASPEGIILNMCRSRGVDVLKPRRLETVVYRDAEGDRIKAQAIQNDFEENIWVKSANESLHKFNQAGKLLGTSFRSQKRSPDNLYRPSLAVDTAGSIWYLRENMLYLNRSLSVDSFELINTFASRPEALLHREGRQPALETSDGLFILDQDRLRAVEGWQRPKALYSQLHVASPDYLVCDGVENVLQVLLLQDTAVVAIDTVELNFETYSAHVYPTKPFQNSPDSQAVRMLLATADGVYTLRKDTDSAWTFEQRSLAEVVVADVAIDASGTVWASTDAGLAILQDSQQTLISTAQGISYGGGVQGGIHLLGNTHLIAGFTDALVSFRQNELLALQTRGIVYPREAWIDNKPLIRSPNSFSDGLVVGANQRSLELALGTHSNFDLERPKIEYSVPSLGLTWRQADPGGIVRLAGVAPGNHVVLARARTASGHYTDSYSLPVRVLEPLYRRLWFQLVMLLAIASLIALSAYIIYRRGLRKQEEKYREDLAIRDERDRLRRQLHDGMGTGLGNILFLTQDKSEEFSYEVQDRIAEIGQELLANMSNIVYALEKETSVSEFCEHIAEQVTKNCNDRGVRCSVQSLREMVNDHQKLSTSVKAHVSLLITEAVYNALRHSNAQNIIVSANRNKEGLQFCVEDDGAGFDIDSARAGNGLENIRHRAKELNATVTIHSKPGEGTHIGLQIPNHSL